MSSGSVSIFWKVSTGTTYTGVPVDVNTKNDLDALGILLDLRRLPGEIGADYVKRLLSVMPLRGNATQEGLVHGVTRELGLDERIGIEISPVSYGNVWAAPSPYVEVTSTTVTLYSSYTSSTDNTVDVQVDIFDHGEGYLVSDLLERLNTSSYFVAELGPGMTGEEKSNGLIPTNSNVTAPREFVPPSTYFFLNHSDLIPGTLTFSEKEVFKTELSPELDTNPTDGVALAWSVNTPVTGDGQYYVDYKRGVVTSFLSPTTRGYCRYIYRDFPFRIRWSPVVVYSLRDTNYKEKVFEDETMPDDSERHGLVTDEGRQVYQDVFARSPSMWGD
jgi:hypothetical protein